MTDPKPDPCWCQIPGRHNNYVWKGIYRQVTRETSKRYSFIILYFTLSASDYQHSRHVIHDKYKCTNVKLMTGSSMLPWQQEYNYTSLPTGDITKVPL